MLIVSKEIFINILDDFFDLILNFFCGLYNREIQYIQAVCVLKSKVIPYALNITALSF